MLQIHLPPRIDRTELYRTDPQEHHADNLISQSAEGMFDNKRVILYVHGYEMEDLRREILAIGKLPTSRRQSGVPSRSLTFGFLPRLPTQGRDFCARSSTDRKYPALREVLYKHAEICTEILKKFFPERYELSRQAIATVRPNWIIPNSVFTSGIINQNNPLQFHYDAGNFEGTWAVMLTLRHQVTGGHLILPELNVKLNCADSSMAIFNNQEELHGVSPIRKMTDDAYRYTIVFYSMENICHCESPESEMRRGQISRTRTEMKRAGLIK